MGQLTSLCCGICMLGKGPRGNNAVWWALGWLSVTSPATHKQLGPFWCWFPGGWFCVHSRTLWVPPMNSPVRLGVSLNHHNPHRFLPPEISRLSFPAVEPWVAQSVSLPSSSRFIYIQIWDLCILQPQPHLPHPPAIALLCVLSLPRMLISAPPTGLDECFFFNSLSDFHTIQFSGCSGGFLFLNLLSFF